MFRAVRGSGAARNAHAMLALALKANTRFDLL